jgi:hypothetical protein
MVVPVVPIGQKPPLMRLGPDPHDRSDPRERRPDLPPRRRGGEGGPGEPEADWLSLEHRHRPAQTSCEIETLEEAAAVTTAVDGLIRADRTRAAAAHGHPCGHRAWQLVN